MLKRILIAGLLGGLTLFAWEFVAHMALGLGEAGVRALPAEAPVQAVIREQVPEAGFYLFPAPAEKPGMTGDQKQKAMNDSMERARTEATGIMIVFPKGREYQFGQLLVVQFVIGFLTALIAAFLLSKSAIHGYLTRVMFVGLLGLLPVLQVDLPQWNWYGFPVTYTAAQLVVHLVGFLLTGLVVAKVVREA